LSPLPQTQAPGYLVVDAKLQGEVGAPTTPSHCVVSGVVAIAAQKQEKVQKGASHHVCFFY